MSFTTELQDLKSKIEALIAAGGIVEPALISQLAEINQALDTGGGGGTPQATIEAAIDNAADIETIKLNTSAYLSDTLTQTHAVAGDLVIMSGTPGTVKWVHALLIQNKATTEQTVLLKRSFSTFAEVYLPADNNGFGIFLQWSTPLLFPDNTALTINLAASTPINYSLFSRAIS